MPVSLSLLCPVVGTWKRGHCCSLLVVCLSISEAAVRGGDGEGRVWPAGWGGVA